MKSHQPLDCLCPFCDWLNGNETEYKQNSDIVFQDEFVTAFISPKWWVNNPGHVIIIPNRHYENLYEIPDDLLSRVYITAKKLAIAMHGFIHRFDRNIDSPAQ
jgi:histidine triad (HIT) family protein